MSDVEARFAAQLAAWAADDAVLGAILFGSRSVGAPFERSGSDFDVTLVVADDPASRRTPHGSPIEVWPMTLEQFRVHGLPGSPTVWNRPAFLTARVLLDRRDGGIARLAAAKATLGPDEARDVARAALDDYLNAMYRSLRNLEGRRALAGRLDGLESLPPLLTTVFALEGRVRPFNKWLAYEVERRPLAIPGFTDALAALAEDPSAEAQRAMFRRVESAGRAARHGAVIDAWEPDVAWLRGG